MGRLASCCRCSPTAAQLADLSHPENNWDRPAMSFNNAMSPNWDIQHGL